MSSSVCLPLSIYLSVCLSASVHPSDFRPIVCQSSFNVSVCFRVSVCESIRPPVHALSVGFVCLSLPVYLTLCVSMSLSVCLFLYMSVSVCVYLSVYLSVCSRTSSRACFDHEDSEYPADSFSLHVYEEEEQSLNLALRQPWVGL